MRMVRGFMLALVLLGLGGVLAGCESIENFQFWDTKKKLPGERKPVFPDGVPGVTQGIPPDLMKGYQEPQQPAVDPAAAAAQESAEKIEPKPEPKPKPKPKVAQRPPHAPAAQQPQPAQDAPQPQPTQAPWPGAQPQAQQQTAPWPSQR